ncbi:DUF4910 domain-containing protein [Acidobacteria bacterium AH-259-D05]|nr:DUF4910 domain-containing protein [Acidobacteria bacterium AH-259-D05]
MAKYDDHIDMLALLNKIAPLKRTLASDDTDRALEIVREYVPNARIEGFETGKKVWSWTIPHRWELKKATIRSDGKILVDSDWCHLHVVNYSQPFEGIVTHKELLQKLHTNPDCPDAIPFKYSFYEPNWGFCVPHNWLDRFVADRYEVEIDCQFIQGSLNTLSAFLPGAFEQTFIICSNVCHPTQVNDPLTGLAVFIDVINRLWSRKRRKYSYLLLVVPETIGSIAYLSHHPEVINCSIGGFFNETVGTKGPLVAQLTRKGDTYWDSALMQSLQMSGKEHRIVPFLKSAANDEKVLDSPGVDIPTLSLTRSPFPEYHTSKDNMDIIDINQMRDARDVIQTFFDLIEDDYIPSLNQPGPIFLSGHGLYPNWEHDRSQLSRWLSFLDVMYAIDGHRSLIEIARDVKGPIEPVRSWCDAFSEKGLLKKNQHVVNSKAAAKKVMARYRG